MKQIANVYVAQLGWLTWVALLQEKLVRQERACVELQLRAKEVQLLQLATQQTINVFVEQ